MLLEILLKTDKIVKWTVNEYSRLMIFKTRFLFRYETLQ